MHSISVPSSTVPPSYDQSPPSDGTIGTPKVIRSENSRPNTPPGTEPREIPSIIIYRSKRDADAAMEHYGSAAGVTKGIASEAALGGIRHQLRQMCAPTQSLEWKPVPGITETLGALAQSMKRASSKEAEAIAATLNSDLPKPSNDQAKLDSGQAPLSSDQADLNSAQAKAQAQRQKDIELLKTAVNRVLRGEDPMEVLGDIAETKLVLPKLTIREEGQEEPSQKAFDSTLVSFASGSYDHGPLGRSLLLEGGRARFAGPSEAQRAAKLREVIFALPNPPASGQPLEDMADIYQGLTELGIDI